MVTIHSTSDSGSGSTETTVLIQCINGRDPQINKLWCLGLDSIYREIHSTAYVEILGGTVREFITDYLAEMDVKLRLSENFLSTSPSNFVVV